MITTLLVLLVLQAVALSVGGGYVCWLLLGRAVQAQRVDLDMTQQALKMQAIIDERVQARVGNVTIDSLGRVVKPQAQRGLPEQPPAPNVRTRTIIDDVHEMEREANRIIGESDYAKRDLYEAPLPPMEA